MFAGVDTRLLDSKANELESSDKLIISEEDPTATKEQQADGMNQSQPVLLDVTASEHYMAL